MRDDCVTGRFVPRPQEVAALRGPVPAQAAASLGDPGCPVLTVCPDFARPEGVSLHEIGRDRPAVDTHPDTPHFLTFDTESAPLVAEKHLMTHSERISVHG
jgi:quinol monooxygenase YgiN